MAREEIKRSLHFMLKLVVADVTGGASVAAVTEEEVVTIDESEVDLGIVATGGGIQYCLQIIHRHPSFPHYSWIKYAYYSQK